MSKLTDLKKLLEHDIKDLYSAETQLVKALPKMAKAASGQALKDAFTSHLEETKRHVERLEKAAGLIGSTPRGKSCKAMKGLIEEGEETIKEEGDPHVLDLALITAAQKVEHYEIAGYGSARSLARSLGLADVVSLIEETLNEEGGADKKLTGIAKTVSKAAPRPEK